MKRAIVVSGGGSKGAYAGGMLEFLMRTLNLKYDVFIGTSTGALLSVLACCNEIELAKKAFTTTKQEDIFDVNPFVINKNKSGTFLSFNHLNIIKQFLKGKRTFGESKALKKTIEKFFTQEMFESIDFNKKTIFITVSNLTTNKLEYINLKDFSYNEVVDWIWISCNYAPFMSIVKKNNFYYGDGGFAGYIGIEKAIELGSTSIDALVLDTQDTLLNYTNFNNPISSMLRINDFMFDRLRELQIENAILKSSYKNIDLTIHYLPYYLTDQSLIFDTQQMKKWWEEGKKHIIDVYFGK